MTSAAVKESSLARSRKAMNGAANPWATDFVLMSLSVWWVRTTHPSAAEFESEVAMTMSSLAREVR